MSDECGDLSDRDVCCDASDCCSPLSGGAGRWWKTAIFAVVMLLAVGVAGHSLLTDRAGSIKPCDETGSVSPGTSAGVTNPSAGGISGCYGSTGGATTAPANACPTADVPPTCRAKDTAGE